MSKDWNPHRAKLKRLYLEEGRTLDEVKERLEVEDGFIASIRAYRSKFDEWNFRKYRSAKNPQACYISPKRANRTRKAATNFTGHSIPPLAVTVDWTFTPKDPNFPTSATTYSAPLASMEALTSSTTAPSSSLITPTQIEYPELHLPHVTHRNSFATEPMKTIHIPEGPISAKELSGRIGIDSPYVAEAFFMKWQDDGEYLAEVLKRIRSTQVTGHILNPTICGKGNIFRLLQERVPEKNHQELIATLLKARFPPQVSTFVAIPKEDWVEMLCDSFSTTNFVGWKEKSQARKWAPVRQAGGWKLVRGARILLAERHLAQLYRTLVKYTNRIEHITLPIDLYGSVQAYAFIMRDTEQRGYEVEVFWYTYYLTLERLFGIITLPNTDHQPVSTQMADH